MFKQHLNIKSYIQIITVKWPIIVLIYKIYKHPSTHENADNLSFPMINLTVVYTLYSAPDTQFNNIPILLTHNFPLKWFPWRPKSCNMSTISVLTSIPSEVKIGLKLTKLQLDFQSKCPIKMHLYFNNYVKQGTEYLV